MLTEQECKIHYWVCETPNGVTSIAHCKYCGKKEEFRNSFRDSDFTNRFSFKRASKRDRYNDVEQILVKGFKGIAWL